MKKCFSYMSAILTFIYADLYGQILPYCFQGHTSDSSAKVWCMTNSADSSTIFLTDATGNKNIITPQWNNFDKYAYTQFEISGLNFKNANEIHFGNEKKLSLKKPYQSQDSLRLLIGSCAMITFGQHWIFRPNFRYPIYDVMAKEDNDAMVWMGDNLYFLGKEAYSDKKQTNKYIKTRKVPQLAEFLQSTIQYAMWDDHDFGPNNSDGTFRLKDVSKKNFLHFWPNPTPVDSLQGIYYSIKYPQADIIMTDNRYHAVNGERYFSDEQMMWIQETLKNSNAPFKIIISGNQANNTRTRHETLYATGEFQKIIDFVKENQISGVLFVNGDRHHSEMFKYKLPDIYPIYEFTNSCLTSVATKVRRRSQEFKNENRIHGATKAHVFGKITITNDPHNQEEKYITLSTINKRGKLLWEQTIALSEISYGNQNILLNK